MSVSLAHCLCDFFCISCLSGVAIISRWSALRSSVHASDIFSLICTERGLPLYFSAMYFLCSSLWRLPAQPLNPLKEPPSNPDSGLKFSHNFVFTVGSDMTTPMNTRSSVSFNILSGSFAKIKFACFCMLFDIQVSGLKVVFMELGNSVLHTVIYLINTIFYNISGVDRMVKLCYNIRINKESIV